MSLLTHQIPLTSHPLVWKKKQRNLKKKALRFFRNKRILFIHCYPPQTSDASKLFTQKSSAENEAQTEEVVL